MFSVYPIFNPLAEFIVTTHSPFIVQSLKSDELINLDAITDINPADFSVGEIATHVATTVSPI